MSINASDASNMTNFLRIFFSLKQEQNTELSRLQQENAYFRDENMVLKAHINLCNEIFKSMLTEMETIKNDLRQTNKIFNDFVLNQLGKSTLDSNTAYGQPQGQTPQSPVHICPFSPSPSVSENTGNLFGSQIGVQETKEEELPPPLPPTLISKETEAEEQPNNQALENKANIKSTKGSKRTFKSVKNKSPKKIIKHSTRDDVKSKKCEKSFDDLLNDYVNKTPSGQINKDICRYGSACTKINNSDHKSRYLHTCLYTLKACKLSKDEKHLSEFMHW